MVGPGGRYGVAARSTCAGLVAVRSASADDSSDGIEVSDLTPFVVPVDGDPGKSITSRGPSTTNSDRCLRLGGKTLTCLDNHVRKPTSAESTHEN